MLLESGKDTAASAKTEGSRTCWKYAGGNSVWKTGSPRGLARNHGSPEIQELVGP